MNTFPSHAPFPRKIRGIRDNIPPGFILGRLSTGNGGVELLPISDFVQHVITTQAITKITSGTVITMTGDVTGPNNANTVVAIQNIAVKSGVPTNGFVLTYVAANSRWEPAAGGGGGSGYPAGTVPTVVQVAHATSAIAATFGVAPTNGNLLVAMTFNSANNLAAAGWTKQVENATGTDWGDIFTKVAGAGESTTQQPLSTATVNGGIVIWEINGQNANFFVTGNSQVEQTGAQNTPVLLPNVKNCIGLAALGLVTGVTISAGQNAGTQDVLDNTGNRHLFAGHTDLSQTPMVGVLAEFSGSGNSKCCTCLITS